MKFQSKWVVARLQFTMLLQSAKWMALILTERKMEIPERQPLEKMISNPWFNDLQQVHVKQLSYFASYRTISYSVVSEFQLGSYIAARQQRLSWEMKKKRLVFAKST